MVLVLDSLVYTYYSSLTYIQYGITRYWRDRERERERKMNMNMKMNMEIGLLHLFQITINDLAPSLLLIDRQ